MVDPFDAFDGFSASRKAVRSKKTVVNHTLKEFTMDSVSSHHGPPKDMTDMEAKVYSLLVDEFLSPAQISRRLKISKSRVSFLVSSLRKKGFVNAVNYTPVNYRCTGQGVVNDSRSQSPLHPVRLHGQQFRVSFISTSEAYHRVRARADSKLLMGNRVALYRDSCSVFSYESFLGVDADDCDRQAGEYWLRFFTRLESDLGVVVLKDRANNVREVKHHYAETHNELAGDLRRRRSLCRVFGTKDGKEWLLFDDSKGLDEAECTHSENAREPRDARDDISLLQNHFNDIRDNASLLLPSQLQSLLQDQARLAADSARMLHETTVALSILSKGLVPREGAGVDDSEVLPVGRPDYCG